MSLKKIHGGQRIPLYSQTSYDWHNAFQEPSYAVNLDAGINEYVFGRTTPNNKFIVSTGLVNDQIGVQMVGGKKNKVSKEIKSKVDKKVKDKEIKSKVDKKVKDKEIKSKVDKKVKDKEIKSKVDKKVKDKDIKK
jgi:hypothetical protein